MYEVNRTCKSKTNICMLFFVTCDSYMMKLVNYLQNSLQILISPTFTGHKKLKFYQIKLITFVLSAFKHRIFTSKEIESCNSCRFTNFSTDYFYSEA